jgi:hypothetical protein
MPRAEGQGYVVDGMLQHIFGPYYQSLRISQALGRFNMCLAKCPLLFFDETMPAWAPRQASSRSSDRLSRSGG